MKILFAMIQGVAGIFCFMAVWLAVQHFIRKSMERAPDFDVLEEMTHGCGNCGHESSCGGGRRCDQLSVSGGAL